MGRSRRNKAEEFEGKDIMHYLEHDIEAINDDELTKGRIRTIYTRLKYGLQTASEIADYYDLPIKLIKDIGSGKAFKEITKDI